LVLINFSDIIQIKVVKLYTSQFGCIFDKSGVLIYY